MTNDKIIFASGHPDYANEAAILIYDSSHEILDFMFKDKDIAINALVKLYKKKKGHFSHKFSTIAMKDKEIVGLELGYSKKDLDKQDLIGGIYLLISSPLSLWWHIITKVGPVVDNYVPKASEGSYYLNNLAVNTKKRSGGVGRLLLENITKRAKKSGYSNIEGDVTKVNIRAIKFYEKNGYVQISESNNQEEYKKLGLPPLVRIIKKLNI
ncbi:GNAT family N-acetyltransferase [Rickettsiales bacterium]|nr:GNAT family N-acetyltransferase [Rickettsiales bacterium]